MMTPHFVALDMICWAAHIVAEGRCGPIYATAAMATTAGEMFAWDALTGCAVSK